jgi:ParB-like chromosome segregation protein Spo0J
MTCEFDAVSGGGAGYAEGKPGLASLEDQQTFQSVVMVLISSLQCSDSPRLSGENVDHIRALAESGVAFPPITVNRCTMRVIDGMHRLRATTLRGQDKIAVRFFEGEDRDAFVFAVEANIKHGLPLSLTDRTAAAIRIINSHPEWSDRAIASSTGLAATTVGQIRRRSTAHNAQLNTRVGRDGRIRPLNAAEGRRIAAELMAHEPNASLRQIASAAGISLGTAQNVRQRLRCGNDPVYPKDHETPQQKAQSEAEVPLSRQTDKAVSPRFIENRPMLLQMLLKDPSLRFSDAGRTLIHLLNALAVGASAWDRLIDDLPPHCAHAVSNAARACAQLWQDFANRLLDSHGDHDFEEP